MTSVPIASKFQLKQTLSIAETYNANTTSWYDAIKSKSASTDASSHSYINL